MGTGLRKANADIAEHATISQDSSLLMQHVAQKGRDPPEGRRQGKGRERSQRKT